MKRAMTGILTAALIFVAACTSEPATVGSENAELDALTVRMNELQDKVVAEGRMTPQLKRDLASLIRDVEGWQARTARSDLSVTTSSPREAPGTQALIAGPGGGTSSCTPCPLTKSYDDMVCFLIDEGPCGDGRNGKVCVYTCIKRTRTAALPASKSALDA